jgi:predicted nuclease of predicted toxin-antitoxin system
VRLFIDECLSPQLADRLNRSGLHDAVHPLHIGRRGTPDHTVLAWCIAEDRVIVTQNGRDFRRLLASTELHPGLIILASTDRERSWGLLQAAIAFLEQQGEPMSVMVNHVLEARQPRQMTISRLSVT